MTVTAVRPRLRPANVAPAPTENPLTLAVLGDPDVAFVALGVPGPQGSKSFKGMRTSKKTGRTHAVMAESSKKVAPWRAEVGRVAREATGGPWTPLAGAVVADMVFTLAPPKGRFPKNNPVDLRWVHGMPTVYPDLSKLVRSTEDGMTGIVWHDDARLIGFRRVAKLYVGADDPDALRKPGAIIRVWTLPETLHHGQQGSLL